MRYRLMMRVPLDITRGGGAVDAWPWTSLIADTCDNVPTVCCRSLGSCTVLTGTCVLAMFLPHETKQSSPATHGRIWSPMTQSRPAAYGDDAAEMFPATSVDEHHQTSFISP